MRSMPRSQQEKQQGSVLLLTLVIMLIFTFAGLMVMEMAILEEIAVSNEQRTLQVYQTAYSEIEAQLLFLKSNPDVMNTAISGDIPLTSILNPSTCSNPGDICQTVTLRYTGQSAPPAGYSIGSFVGLNFEIDSIAQLNSTGAVSSQTMGFTYVTQKPGGS